MTNGLPLTRLTPSAAFNQLHVAATPMLTKAGLARISNDLYSNTDLRAQFAADPMGFLEKHYGMKPSEAEQGYFKDIAARIADGWSCGGCGCAMPDPGAAVSLPAARAVVK